MRRREKRLLQVAGLLLAALLFLPNVGLWSLYRDRAFYNSPNTDGPGGIVPLQVSRARRATLRFRRGFFFLKKGSFADGPPKPENPDTAVNAASLCLPPLKRQLREHGPQTRQRGSGLRRRAPRREAAQPGWLLLKVCFN